MESLDIYIDITSERKEPELSPLRPMFPGSQLAIRFWIARRVLQFSCDQYNVRKEFRVVTYLRSLKNVMREIKGIGLEYGPPLSSTMIMEWLFSAPEGTRHVYKTLSGPGFFVECMFEVPGDIEYASSDSYSDEETDDVLLLHWRMRVSHPLGISSQVTEFGRWVKRKSRKWWKENMRFYEKEYEMFGYCV